MGPDGICQWGLLCSCLQVAEKRRLLGARREAGARYWYWCWLWSCLRVDGKSRLLATRKEAYRLGTNKMVVPFLTDPV